MLFFSSSRPGGIGGKDLWYSVYKSNKKKEEYVDIYQCIFTAMSCRRKWNLMSKKNPAQMNREGFI